MPGVSFGKLLTKYLGALEARTSWRNFADQCKVDHSWLYRIAHDQRSPPPEFVKKAADVLKLRGIEREQFIECGRSQRAKARQSGREYFESVEEETRELRRMLATLAGVTRAVIDSAREAGTEVPERLVESLGDIEARLQVLKRKHPAPGEGDDDPRAA